MPGHRSPELLAFAIQVSDLAAAHVFAPLWVDGGVGVVEKRRCPQQSAGLEALRLVQLVRQVGFDRQPAPEHQVIANGPGRQGQRRDENGDSKLLPRAPAIPQQRRTEQPHAADNRVHLRGQAAETSPDAGCPPVFERPPPAEAGHEYIHGREHNPGIVRRLEPRSKVAEHRDEKNGRRRRQTDPVGGLPCERQHEQPGGDQDTDLNHDHHTGDGAAIAVAHPEKSSLKDGQQRRHPGRGAAGLPERIGKAFAQRDRSGDVEILAAEVAIPRRGMVIRLKRREEAVRGRIGDGEREVGVDRARRDGQGHNRRGPNKHSVCPRRQAHGPASGALSSLRNKRMLRT